MELISICLVFLWELASVQNCVVTIDVKKCCLVGIITLISGTCLKDLMWCMNLIQVK